ncbi:hypothetical protein M91_11782, partial [Bos mutus]
HAGTDIAQVTTDAMVLKAVFLFQAGAGILGNSFLLSTYSSSFLTAHRPKPTDVVLSSLAVANSLVLVSKGTPHVVGVLGLPGALGTAGCKVTYYLRRVSRDRSLCTTCLLSCLQATTISRKSAVWAALKGWASKNVGSSCLFCWTLNLAINSFSPMQVSVSWDNNSVSRTENLLFCQYKFSLSGISVIPVSFVGAMLIVLMILASVHMVCLLHSPHRRVHYILHSSLSRRTSPEKGAADTILLVVANLIPFYFLNPVYIFYDTKYNLGELYRDFNKFLCCYRKLRLCDFILFSHFEFQYILC